MSQDDALRLLGDEAALRVEYRAWRRRKGLSEPVCDDAGTGAQQPPKQTLWNRLSLTADHFPTGPDYAVLGYPDDDYWRDGKGVTLELTYSAGHVRRHRGPGELPGIKGAHFLELSHRAGAGCSGAPLLQRPTVIDGPHNSFRVFGLYVGERTSGTPDDVAPLSFGYALPFSAVANWCPEMTNGRSLFTASR